MARRFRSHRLWIQFHSVSWEITSPLRSALIRPMTGMERLSQSAGSRSVRRDRVRAAQAAEFCRSRSRALQLGGETGHHALLELAGFSHPDSTERQRRSPRPRARNRCSDCARTAEHTDRQYPTLTALPDPTGWLAAIQNGNMFRDMSGMSEVVKLAQSAIRI